MTSSHPLIRHRVAELLARGLSGRQVAASLGITPATVSYHRKRLGESDARFSRRYDWLAIQAFHDAGNSRAACQARFGFATGTWYSAVSRGLLRTDKARPDRPFSVKRRPPSRSFLKARLIAGGFREARCEQCGLSEWRGQPLSLSLHHINGNGLDNRLANLQLLCPNCHAQTPNFGIKNRKLRAP